MREWMKVFAFIVSWKKSVIRSWSKLATMKDVNTYYAIDAEFWCWAFFYEAQVVIYTNSTKAIADPWLSSRSSPTTWLSCW